jgi:hypothetical protein
MSATTEMIVVKVEFSVETPAGVVVAMSILLCSAGEGLPSLLRTLLCDATKSPMSHITTR